MRTIHLECPSCGRVFAKQLAWQKIRFNKSLGASVTYADECPKCGKILEVEVSRDDLLADD